MSDHYPCFVLLRLSDLKDGESSYFTRRKFNDNSLFNIKHSLLHRDWMCMDDMLVDESYTYLVNVITNAMNLFAPMRTKKVSNVKSFSEPWMNVKFLKYNRKCKKLCMKAKTTKKMVDIDKYKEYRRSLNVLKKFEKRSFYKKLFEKIGNNSKTVWSILNSLNKKVLNKTELTRLLYNDTILTSEKDIVNALYEHFSNVGLQTERNIKKTKKNRDPMGTVSTCKSELNRIFVTEGEIERIVHTMKSKNKPWNGWHK